MIGEYSLGNLGRAASSAACGSVDLRDRLVEVRERGRLHAVGAGAVVHGVQVLGEDLVFGPPVFELPGQHRLAQLAGEGGIVADVGVLDVLLGDRARALDDVAGLDVVDQGAGDAREVDAVVLVEALVLDGHGGVLHDHRDLAAGHDDAVHRSVELGDALAAAVVDHGVLAELAGRAWRRCSAGCGRRRRWCRWRGPPRRSRRRSRCTGRDAPNACADDAPRAAGGSVWSGGCLRSPSQGEPYCTCCGRRRLARRSPGRAGAGVPGDRGRAAAGRAVAASGGSGRRPLVVVGGLRPLRPSGAAR